MSSTNLPTTVYYRQETTVSVLIGLYSEIQIIVAMNFAVKHKPYMKVNSTYSSAISLLTCWMWSQYLYSYLSSYSLNYCD